MVKQLYINGVGSGTYGVYLNSDTYLDSPSIDYTEYSVPARDGSLINNNKRLNNVERKFECFINSNAVSNLDAFKKLIYTANGYMKIESDYDTDTYQMGYLSQEIQVEPFRDGSNLQINFTLYFSCMPQKFYKNNTTAYKSLFNGDASNVLYVLPRYWNDSNNGVDIAKMISKIPADQQPKDEYFGCLYMGYGFNNDTLTNISASASGSGFVAVVSERYTNSSHSFYKCICYGYGSASKSSFAFPNSQTYDYNLWVIFAIKPNVVVSCTATSAEYGALSKSFNSANYQVTVSNSNAIGLDIDFDARFHLENSGSKTNSPIYVESKLNGISQKEAIYIVHFEQMDDSLISEIVSKYGMTDSTSGYNYVNVLIGTDNTATIYKNTDTMDITSYLEVDGEIDGKSDEIKATLYLGYTDRGSIRRCELKPRWWKL